MDNKKDEKNIEKTTPEQEIKIADNSVSEGFAKKYTGSLMNYLDKNQKIKTDADAE